MATYLEPDAPRSINCVKYLVSELLKREPLKYGKTIKVRISEDSPNFPEFTDNILEDNQNFKPERRLEAMDKNVGHKLISISKFLIDKFKYHTAVLMPQLQSLDPFVLDIPLVSLDPKGLYEMAEKWNVNNHDSRSNTRVKEQITTNKSIGIFYNPKTGLGYSNNKRFKFSNKSKNFSVFNELWHNFGNPVPREVILKLIKYSNADTLEFKELTVKDIKKKPDHTYTTYLINDLAKSLRDTTSLSADEIINNNGDITLVGKKLKFPPK